MLATVWMTIDEDYSRRVLGRTGTSSPKMETLFSGRVKKRAFSSKWEKQSRKGDRTWA